MAISILLNGEKMSFEQPLRCAQLLENLKIAPQKVAIAKNLEVIPPSQLDQIFIEDGDEIEIFHAVGGG